MRDRRSGRERRATSRTNIEMDVEWASAKGRSSGSMSDISPEGCFVLCSGDVEDGQSVKLFIPLADGMKAEFAGRVANHVAEIGFGPKFENLSSAQAALEGQIIESTK